MVKGANPLPEKVTIAPSTKFINGAAIGELALLGFTLFIRGIELESDTVHPLAANCTPVFALFADTLAVVVTPFSVTTDVTAPFWILVASAMTGAATAVARSGEVNGGAVLVLLLGVGTGERVGEILGGYVASGAASAPNVVATRVNKSVDSGMKTY